MPYKLRGELETPPDDTVLWRYLDLLRFMEIIQRRKLWFSSASKFEDPLEGTWTDGELNQVNELYGREEAKAWLSGSLKERAAIYVNCWRQGSNESMAMWDIYGKNGASVAIKSTVGLLKKALTNERNDIHIARVQYVDPRRLSMANGPLMLCSRKSSSYEHENEVRVLVFGRCYIDQQGRSLITGGDFDPATLPSGIEIDFEPHRFITEAVVGPREQARMHRLIEDVLNRYDARIKITDSRLLNDRRL
jgi:hypothetical protein